MPWVRLDDEFYAHPKLIEVGPLGLALQVAGLCYSNRYLTDGFISQRVLQHLLDYEGITLGNDDVNCKMVAALLVDAGLWEECEDGYQIHDYSQYQPTRESILSERAQKAAAGAAGGKATAAARAAAGAVAPAVAESKPVPVPVIPEPMPEPDPAPVPPRARRHAQGEKGRSSRNGRGDGKQPQAEEESTFANLGSRSGDDPPEKEARPFENIGVRSDEL